MVATGLHLESSNYQDADHSLFGNPKCVWQQRSQAPEDSNAHRVNYRQGANGGLDLPLLSSHTMVPWTSNDSCCGARPIVVIDGSIDCVHDKHQGLDCPLHRAARAHHHRTPAAGSRRVAISCTSLVGQRDGSDKRQVITKREHGDPPLSLDPGTLH